MRDSLTFLAIVLILILTAALVGPYFVDWNAQRDFIEARLTRMLGSKAQIHGAIDLKLLPTPYFVVENIEVGDKAGPLRLSAAKLRLEIGIAPLLHGDVDFLEARLEAPRLDITVPTDGTFAIAPPTTASAAHMRFERIFIKHGTISVADPAKNRSFELNAIDLDAEAGSLFGPFKGNGALDIAGERSAFRFASSTGDHGRLKLKLVVDASASRPHIDLDGVLSLRDGAPSFAGAAKFESVATALPWRLTGLLDADAERAAMDHLELRIGEEDQPLRADGEAELDFSATPKGKVTLRSGQIDLDHWLSANAFDPDAAWADLDFTPPFPLVVNYAAQTLTFRDESFTDLSGNLILDAAKAAGLRFEVHGPGRSRLFLDGQWRRGLDADFSGKIEASAGDARRLPDWLKAIAPQYAPQSLPFRAGDLSANAHVSHAGAALRELDAELDGSRFSGTLDYAPATHSHPSRIEADLTTPSLDLGSFPGFDARAFLGKSDGSLRLEANAVTLGGIGPGGGPSIGDLGFKLVKAGDAFELEELTFEGLDGAIVTASGALLERSAHVDARVLAPRTRQLAALLAKIAPSPLTQTLLSRAENFAPLDLNVTADAAAGQEPFAINALSAKGTIGATRIAATIGDDPKKSGNLAIAATADAKDSLSLLRLFAAPTSQSGGIGPGHIELKAHGPPGQDSDAKLDASLGPTNLTFQGRINADLARFSASGALRLLSPDIAPLLRTTGLAFPDFASKFPAALSGDLAYDNGAASLENFKANLSDAMFSGALAYGKAGAKTLTGSIDIDKLSAAALFGLVLGSPEGGKAGAIWSSVKFPRPAFDLPASDLALTIRSMPALANLFPVGASARNARLTLASSPGFLDLRDLRFDVGDGTATGEVKLRRTGADVSLEGHLQLNDAALDLAGGRGRLSANLDIAGAGQSPDALVGGLAGAGHATIADLTIPRADPLALARVLAAFEKDNATLATGDVTRALGTELQKAALKAGSREFDLGVVAGMLHLSPTPVDRVSFKPDQPVSASIAASFDLRRALLNESVTFVLNAPPKDWSGSAPQITLYLKGPLSNPVPQLDAAAFANELAARAIMRESARIESYEFDIHERAFFYQRLLSERRWEKERLKAAEDAKAATPPAEAGATQ
ncbi:MAG: AsmA family protein [Methylocella sp.]